MEEESVDFKELLVPWRAGRLVGEPTEGVEVPRFVADEEGRLVPDKVVGETPPVELGLVEREGLRFVGEGGEALDAG